MGIAKTARHKGAHRYEWLGYYLWLLPAIVLILVFLVIPTIQTFYLSLHQPVTFSESEFRRQFTDDLKKAGGREVNSADLIEQVPNWRQVADSYSDQYKIHIAPGDINGEMTVKETAEMMIVAINTSRQGEDGGQQFAGLRNYSEMIHDSTMLTAFKNNLIWLVVFTILTVVLGLFIATLADKVPWSTLAKTVIFLPMAISGAASAVIWNFMYFK